MKMPFKAKIEKAASSDLARPVLTNILLRIVETTTGRGRNRKVTRQGYLEATNSYILARIPVEVAEDDHEGYLPRQSLALARKQGELEAHETVSKVGALGIDRPSREGHQWPDFDQLIPKDKSIVAAVGINAKLLHELAQALGSPQEWLRLEFQGKNVIDAKGKIIGYTINPQAAIRVKPMGGEVPDAVGLIMPVRLS